MAKLPVYMKLGPMTRDENGDLSQVIIINKRHPAFFWFATKTVFASYQWWRPRFWVEYLWFFVRWLTGRL